MIGFVFSFITKMCELLHCRKYRYGKRSKYKFHKVYG